jgi:hypothetical protein
MCAVARKTGSEDVSPHAVLGSKVGKTGKKSHSGNLARRAKAFGRLGVEKRADN